MKDITNTSNDKLEVSVIPNGQYLKKKEFEAFINMYELNKLEPQNKPSTDVDLNLQVHNQDTEKGVYEVVINIVTKTKIEDRDLFSMNIDYGGIFTISSKNGLIDDGVKEQILMIHCPTILFPYIRKEISTESVEAGFPPLILNNIDFGALYKNKQENESEQKSMLV